MIFTEFPVIFEIFNDFIDSCTDYHNSDIDQNNIKIDENHRKTKFPMILMKFDIRNSFFEPHHHII